MMNSTIQIMPDQALFANTNALFKDCRLIDPYNTTIRVNHMVDLDKLWSNFGVKRLKTDQDSPVSIFVAPSSIDRRVLTHVKQKRQEQKQQQKQ